MIRLNCFFQATDGDQYKDALRAAVAHTFLYLIFPKTT